MEPLPTYMRSVGGAWNSPKLSVCLKDATFQKSSASRHAAEFGLLLLAKFAPNAHATRGDVGFELGFTLYEQSSALPPVVVMRTDGGGDHNAPFMQVQPSLISLFCACNL